MKILRAEHLGMCFGVRDAIELALRKAQSGPVTVLGDLVHNEAVIEMLRSRGVEIQQNPVDAKTRDVLITAHGASERSIVRTRELGLNVFEATCPLVHFAHRAVKKLVAEGFHPVIIGKRDHVEVRGLTGDLDDFDVVLNEGDIHELRSRARFGIAAQTTQPVERVRHLVELIRRRFTASEVRFVDTVCQPTKLRQSAAVAVAAEADVMIVVGGVNSNNTGELVRTCARHCARVHHVQTAADLREEWFSGAEVIGITAGTSTPDWIIDAVEQRLSLIAAGMCESVR